MNISFDLFYSLLPIPIIVFFHLVVVCHIILDIVSHQEGSNDTVLFEPFGVASHEIFTDPKPEGGFDIILDQSLLPFWDVDKVITSFIEVVTDALVKGEKVSLKGFGNFEIRERGERTGRNPRTGETMTISASKAPAFKASSALKNAVNK